MNSNLFIATVAGLGAMLGWGFADFFAKKTIDKIGDLTTLFWAQLIGIIPLLFLFLLNPHATGVNQQDIFSLILFGAVSGLSYLPLYHGFGKGQVSLLSPLFASYAAVVAILSAILFHEPIPEIRQFAILIVLCGILLISVDPLDVIRLAKTKKNSAKGMPEVLLAMLVYSVWLVLFDRFLGEKNWVFCLLMIRIFSVVALLLFSIIRKKSLWVKPTGLWKYLIAIGVFDVAAYAFVTYGFSHTTFTSVIALLSATFSVPTIILARVFLRERVTTLQALAALTIIAGVGLIAIS